MRHYVKGRECEIDRREKAMVAWEQLKSAVEDICPGAVTKELDAIEPIGLLKHGVQCEASLGMYRALFKYSQQCHEKIAAALAPAGQGLPLVHFISCHLTTITSVDLMIKTFVATNYTTCTPRLHPQRRPSLSVRTSHLDLSRFGSLSSPDQPNISLNKCSCQAAKWTSVSPCRWGGILRAPAA